MDCFERMNGGSAGQVWVVMTGAGAELGVIDMISREM